jgi:1-acyl-sn-glycerol-3-phosphate acyltransferase
VPRFLKTKTKTTTPLQELRKTAANLDLQELQERGREQLQERGRELRQAAANLDLEKSREQLQERARELRKTAAQLDVRWARSAPARFIRENFMQLVMNPVLDYYASRRATGFEGLQTLKQPVILVANHASHMDTPVILSALPRRLRKRTAVAAAADYFYKNRIVAWLVSLFFNTVPIERKGGGSLSKNGGHLDSLLDDGWNLLLYPEGTRSRGDGLGRVRRGAAVLASAHNISIVPIRVTGTAEAMPPGQIWPKRLRGRLFTKRHRIEVSFGEPIPPLSDPAALVERVTEFFENGEAPPPRKRRRLLRRSKER